MRLRAGWLLRFLLDVDTLEESIERHVVHLDVLHIGLRRRGNPKPATIEALVENAHPAAIEKQHFQCIFSSAEENEESLSSRPR